jgi:hypothetical protein
MSTQRVFKTIASNKKYLTVECSKESCPARVHGYLRKNDTFSVKSTGPSRTWKEVQAELIKINEHWIDIKERGEDMSWWFKHTALWINDSHKEEDIFMSSTKDKKGASSKSKEAASSKPKGVACKGKGPAMSKFDDDDDNDFMPSNWANKASSTKGKRVVKP